jgi:autoinducer 2-degrading protein
MQFRPEAVADFLELFANSCELIRNVPGCRHLSLLRDVQEANIFFTYSWWDGPEFLEQYRQSELFEGVWTQTKTFFNAKPEAWSLTEHTKLI